MTLFVFNITSKYFRETWTFNGKKKAGLFYKVTQQGLVFKLKFKSRCRDGNRSGRLSVWSGISLVGSRVKKEMSKFTFFGQNLLKIQM